jgi:aryl-alcohol dehydrogenase-like predicted oxidoreductase
MLQSVNCSLLRTKGERFSGVYLHDERALESSNAREIVNGVRELLYSGITERVGISVYSIDNALRAKDICPELSLFQVSENICDRRLYKVKEMNKLAQEGNDFYVRSIFLQGLLLMETNDLPKEFSKVTPILKSLTVYANSLNISKEALCLAYARQISWAKGIVVGVASLSQVEQLFAPRVELPEDFEESIATLDLEFLDPRKWPDLK